MAPADLICVSCGVLLTPEEWNYYEIRCEGCERAFHERIQRWREGGPDPELDLRFMVAPLTRH